MSRPDNLIEFQVNRRTVAILNILNQDGFSRVLFFSFGDTWALHQNVVSVSDQKKGKGPLEEFKTYRLSEIRLPVPSQGVSRVPSP